MVLFLIGKDKSKSSSLQLNIKGPALYIPSIKVIIEMLNIKSDNSTYSSFKGSNFSNNELALPQIINIKYNAIKNGKKIFYFLFFFVFILNKDISLVMHALINEYNFFILYFPQVP